jgi:hypothetical protein
VTDSTNPQRRRQYRRTFQLPWATYSALRAYADRIGWPVSALVEHVLDQPITPDVVERARAPSRGPSTRVIEAIRYSHDHAITITEASRLFGVPAQTLRDAWARTYPNVARSLSKRGLP